MLTTVVALTAPAVALKVAVEAPAKTVTEAGVVIAELLSETVTIAPPAGAACASVTVQVEMAPGAIVPGAHCNPVTVLAAGALMVTEAV